jgi:hypothetical protein
MTHPPSTIQKLISKAYQLPLVATGGYCDPYLDVVHKYLKGEGDVCDVAAYLEHAISIQALPYSSVRPAA